MSTLVNTDLLSDLQKFGAAEVNACFSCGNCTAICPLVDDDATFPRRFIRLAQVGLEADLVASKELWTCYQCGVCSTKCPTEAEPAEFMATARRLAERQVSVQKTQDFLTAVTARMRSGFMAAKFDPAVCLADQALEPQSELLQKSDAFTTMLGLFEGAGRGADLRGSRGTAWGLLNAVTEYVDHHNKGNRRQDVSDRYYSAWMGRGKSLKQEALAMAELL